MPVSIKALELELSTTTLNLEENQNNTINIKTNSTQPVVIHLVMKRLRQLIKVEILKH